MTQREKRALIALPIGVVVVLGLRFVLSSDPPVRAANGADSIPLAQKRLVRVRDVAGTVPGKEAALKQVDRDLAASESGVIVVDTAAQAAAKLLETARRLGKTENIDVRGGDFAAPRALPGENGASDYGEVSAAVTFNCHIEELVNFLAALSREPALIAPADIRVAAMPESKDKLINVRMTLAGIVPRKLVPDKKGFTSF